jgi:hypothetical protein
MKWIILPLVSVVAALFYGSGASASEEVEMELSSPAFPEGGNIPAKYTCEGQNISPPLEWSQVPSGTNSFALIMDDPDAPGGTFTHWVLFNLPSDIHKLPEAVPSQKELTNSARQGKNDFRKIGYGGPCPPPGRPHRYCFTLYALDEPLPLSSGASKKQVLNSMKGHILASGKLTGIYRR